MNGGRGRTALAVVAGVALVAGLVGLVQLGRHLRGDQRPPTAATLEQRVATHFGQYAAVVAEKFGTPMPAPYVHVDTVTLADGSRVSLWVSDLPVDSPIPSHYMYLDTESADGSFSHGIGSAGGMTDMVTLQREGGVLLGETGTWPAARIRVEGEGVSTEVRVVRGYFLLAGPLTPSSDPRYMITLIGEDGDRLAVATDLAPPAGTRPIAATPARTR